MTDLRIQNPPFGHDWEEARDQPAVSPARAPPRVSGHTSPKSGLAVGRTPGEVADLYFDEVVEARRRRARRPKSLRSTRPSSAAAASRAARSIASSSTGAAATAS